MADIIVPHRARPLGRQRQAELGGFERLTLAFLIAAQHQRVVRRVEIETDHVQNFSLNRGSLDNLKVFIRCGLISLPDQMRCTELAERRRGGPSDVLQRCRPGGGRVASAMIRATLRLGDGRPPAAAGPVLKAAEAFLLEPLGPHRDAFCRRPQLLRHGFDALAIQAKQHNVRTLLLAHRACGRPRPAPQLLRRSLASA